jgi:cytochrome c oxidase subunit 3/cytochrome o ubiquinol oxidase subunit 3
MSNQGRSDPDTQHVQPAPTPGGVATAAPTAVTAHDPTPPPLDPVELLDKGKVGMAAFLVTEAAFFSVLIAAYIAYMGEGIGPFPKDVFKEKGPVIINTFFLLLSSVTAHMATHQVHRGGLGPFRRWWLATIVLGVLFLLGTGFEWHELIYKHGLTPSRNLFGTTYYTLVGFHAFHVTIGVIVMSLVLGFAFTRFKPTEWPLNAELVSWYWHFVDVVWVVVFTLVYLVST